MFSFFVRKLPWAKSIKMDLHKSKKLLMIFEIDPKQSSPPMSCVAVRSLAITAITTLVNRTVKWRNSLSTWSCACLIYLRRWWSFSLYLEVFGIRTLWKKVEDEEVDTMDARMKKSTTILLQSRSSDVTFEMILRVKRINLDVFIFEKVKRQSSLTCRKVNEESQLDVHGRKKLI